MNSYKHETLQKLADCGRLRRNSAFGSGSHGIFCIFRSVLINSSLKNHGVNKWVDNMFDLGVEAMALPLEEKLRFEQGDDGMSFG